MYRVKLHEAKQNTTSGERVIAGELYAEQFLEFTWCRNQFEFPPAKVERFH